MEIIREEGMSLQELKEKYPEDNFIIGGEQGGDINFETWYITLENDKVLSAWKQTMGDIHG